MKKSDMKKNQDLNRIIKKTRLEIVLLSCILLCKNKKMPLGDCIILKSDRFKLDFKFSKVTRRQMH